MIEYSINEKGEKQLTALLLTLVTGIVTNFGLCRRTSVRFWQTMVLLTTDGNTRCVFDVFVHMGCGVEGLLVFRQNKKSLRITIHSGDLWICWLLNLSSHSLSLHLFTLECIDKMSKCKKKKKQQHFISTTRYYWLEQAKKCYVFSIF